MRRTIAYKILIQLKLIEDLDQIFNVFADSGTGFFEAVSECTRSRRIRNPAYQDLHVSAFNSHWPKDPCYMRLAGT
jgi:hypothetical protein